MPSLVTFFNIFCFIVKMLMTVKGSCDLSDDVGLGCDGADIYSGAYFLVFLSRDPELYSLLDVTVVHFSGF